MNGPSWVESQISTPDDRRLYNQERLREEAALGVYELMQRENVTRAALAERIGRSRSFVTKVLEGSHNFTLDTLADVYLAFGRFVHFSLGTNAEEVRTPTDEAYNLNGLEVYSSSVHTGDFGSSLTRTVRPLPAINPPVSEELIGSFRSPSEFEGFAEGADRSDEWDRVPALSYIKVRQTR